ncbi:MAG: NUDIX hydrolase [Arenibacterium sp.]
MTKRPLLGALAVLVKDDHVLLAQRRNKPDAGLWGYPGGHVEWGETVLEAAVRELREETGVMAKPVSYLTNIDLLLPNEDGKISTHYLLVAVLCNYISGSPVAADDVADARWIPISDVKQNRLPMSARVSQVLNLATGGRFGMAGALHVTQATSPDV